MLRQTLVAGVCFTMLLLVPAARADEMNRKTTFTFDRSVELPGLVLPAGTYVFTVPAIPGLTNIVEVLNANETEILGTFVTVPYEKGGAVPETTHLWFLERKGGQPDAIHEWFYPGSNTGLEFIYR
jgi:hypothetical protein